MALPVQSARALPPAGPPERLLLPAQQHVEGDKQPVPPQRPRACTLRVNGNQSAVGGVVSYNVAQLTGDQSGVAVTDTTRFAFVGFSAKSAIRTARTRHKIIARGGSLAGKVRDP